MTIVTGIEANRSRVTVFADGSELARIPKAHFDKCPLEEGEEFDPEQWIDRVAAAQFADAYEAALTSLDFCARSARELSNTLKRKGFVPPAIEATLERLKDAGLIDDAQYARRMAESQTRKPVGVYAFKRKLMAKGISENDAQEAIAAFDDDQQRAACAEAAQKLWRKYEALPRREARAKLSQALARRGFGWDAIEAVIDDIMEE
ncbi:MAG: RecX family transcriptional regulator [Clostridia bacterium]|nr:RecX family transcriptional regulator [Clostridia bacterium]